MCWDDVAVLAVYLGFFSAFFLLACLLDWLLEKVPFLSRLMDRWIDSVSYYDEWEDDDEDYWEDEDEDGEKGDCVGWK